MVVGDFNTPLSTIDRNPTKSPRYRRTQQHQLLPESKPPSKNIPPGKSKIHIFFQVPIEHRPR